MKHCIYCTAEVKTEHDACTLCRRFPHSQALTGGYWFNDRGIMRWVAE